MCPAPRSGSGQAWSRKPNGNFSGPTRPLVWLVRPLHNPHCCAYRVPTRLKGRDSEREKRGPMRCGDLATRRTNPANKRELPTRAICFATSRCGLQPGPLLPTSRSPAWQGEGHAADTHKSHASAGQEEEPRQSVVSRKAWTRTLWFSPLLMHPWHPVLPIPGLGSRFVNLLDWDEGFRSGLFGEAVTHR